MKPFSHRAGATCMIPRSRWSITAFPSELQFHHETTHILPLTLTGPIKGFTLEQDLERDEVRVFGHAGEGYFHYGIRHVGNELIVLGKRGIVRGERHVFSVEEASRGEAKERLFLGSYKQLNMDKKLGEKEILPALFLLGQKLYPADTVKVTHLLDRMQGVLMPGKKLALPPVTEDRALFLRSAYEQIRSLFIQGDAILDPPFHAGRLDHIAWNNGVLQIEWTKGFLRRVCVSSSGPITIQWPKSVRSFRLLGKQVAVGTAIPQGQTVIIDRFM